MDFRQLRYYVAIVEAQSFSRAAMVLNVAQPALSLHVRNMEADLGTALLLRTPQGVLPTDAGSLLLKRARSLLQDFEETLQAVRDFESEPAGEVHIGLPGTIAEMLSVPLILRMRAQFPQVHLKVAEAMSGFVLSWLHEGRVDLGLLYTPVSERGLRSTPILIEELRLFSASSLASSLQAKGLQVPAQTTVELTQIVDLPMVLPGKNHGLRALIDSELDAQGLELSTVIEVDSYKAIKELVEHGLGYSVLPVNAISTEEQAGRLQSWQLGDPPFRRTVHMVRPFDRVPSKAALAVERICLETLKDLIADGTWQTEY